MQTLAPALLVLPVGHLLHNSEPAELYEFAGPALQVDADSAPPVKLYVPAGHEMHIAAPAELYVPTARS